MHETDNQTDQTDQTDQSENDSWVVGIDGSEAAAHALDWATGHALGRTSRLQLVTSWQAPISGSTIEGVPAGSSSLDRDLLVKGAQRLVDVAADGVAHLDGISINPIVAHGGPSAVLLDAADDAALLVVGSRGRGGFKRLLLGSTSTQCATHASGPTAIVPRAASTESATDIVVGIDGSDNSIAALVWALAFAQPGTRVEALSVWDISPIAVGADQFFFPEATDLAEERFHHLVDNVVAEHTDGSAPDTAGDVTIERTFVTGVPRRILAERSLSTDLMVLGARGHGAIGSALMGSVSTWTLHHTETTTVIVPAPPI
jgi:nucleotide-binding universal stress UspA family protein